MDRPTSTTSGTKALAALLALVLLLSGCIKYEGTIKIEDDGSGTVNVLTALDVEALGAFGDLGDLGGGDLPCEELIDGADIPAGAKVEPYNKDGFCGTRVEFSLPASTDHGAALSDVLDESTRIFKEGDNWFFESNFNADDITGQAEAFGADLFGNAFEDASFVITIDLPGRALAGQNNATSVGNDGRFTWDIDILNPPARLFAQTEPGSGGGTDGGGGIGKILIGVVVLALLGAGAFFFLKKRNEGTDATADSGGGPVPFGAPDMAGSPPVAGATPPMGGGPPLAATPPIDFAAPTTPTAEAVKETVVLSAADVQQFARETVADAANPGDTADTVNAAPATPQPVYDETIGAWIVDDPARGRLQHDPASDTWNPV